LTDSGLGLVGLLLPTASGVGLVWNFLADSVLGLFRLSLLSVLGLIGLFILAVSAPGLVNVARGLFERFLSIEKPGLGDTRLSSDDWVGAA